MNLLQYYTYHNLKSIITETIGSSTSKGACTHVSPSAHTNKVMIIAKREHNTYKQ